MSNSLPRTFDKNPWKFASSTVGERNAYSKVDGRQGWEKRKLESKSLQKQSIPGLFSKINENNLVKIALKGQDLTFHG